MTQASPYGFLVYDSNDGTKRYCHMYYHEYAA
jgi:hypothetical protein